MGALPVQREATGGPFIGLEGPEAGLGADFPGPRRLVVAQDIEDPAGAPARFRVIVWRPTSVVAVSGLKKVVALLEWDGLIVTRAELQALADGINELLRATAGDGV